MSLNFPSFKCSVAIATTSIALLSSTIANEKIDSSLLDNLTKEINSQLKEKKLSAQDFTLWHTLLKNGELNQLKLQLGSYKHIPSCAQIITTIDKVLAIEEKKHADKIQEKYDKNIQSIASSILDSKTASDLDAVLVLINTAQNGLQPYKADYSQKQLYATINKIDQNYKTALRITTNWQDHLSHLAAKDLTKAQYSLKNVASSLSSFPIIPRSKVLQISQKLQGQPNDHSRKKYQRNPLEKITIQFVNGLSAKKTYQLLESANLEEYKRKQAYKFMAKLTPLIKLEEKPTSIPLAQLINNYKTINKSKELADTHIASLYTQYLIKALETELKHPNKYKEASPTFYLDEAAKAFAAKELWDKSEQCLNYSKLLSGSSFSNEMKNFKYNVEHIKLGNSKLATDDWVGAIDSYKQGLNKTSTYVPRELFVNKLAEMLAADKERYSSASATLDDLSVQRQHASTAGVIWRLNQYILSNPSVHNAANRPIPKNMQDLIEKFVELEVQKRIKELQTTTNK